MLAVAQFLVYELGRDNLPYYHQHVWPTEDWNHAVVELVEYEKDCKRLHHVAMHCFTWFMHERADIGV